MILLDIFYNPDGSYTIWAWVLAVTFVAGIIVFAISFIRSRRRKQK